MATVLRLVIFKLLLVLSISHAFAQRQSGELECATTKGAYRVHFTAYQAPKGMAGSAYLVRYCEQIPLAGEIPITLDIFQTYGGMIIRDKPIAVRVVEGAPDAEANRTLLELPAKVYPSGIVEMHLKLPDPGDYHLVVAIGENPSEEDTLTIPVRVGTKSAFFSIDPTTRWLLLLMLVVLAALTAYSFYSGRKTQSKERKVN